MAKYRIRVESMDPADEELRAEFRMGIDCDAFCFLMKTEDGWDVAIHDVNTEDIAFGIAESPQLLAAAIIARGIRDAMRYKRELRGDGLLGMFERIAAGQHGEDDEA